MAQNNESYVDQRHGIIDKNTSEVFKFEKPNIGRSSAFLLM